MDSSIIGFMAVLVVMLLMSAYFSATETAFTSLNRIRIKNLAKDGNKRAAQVLALSERYDVLLSTILIGNNISNILASSFVTLWAEEYYPKSLSLAIGAFTFVVVFGAEVLRNVLVPAGHRRRGRERRLHARHRGGLPPLGVPRSGVSEHR